MLRTVAAAAGVALLACLPGCADEHRTVIPQQLEFLSMREWAAVSNERAVFYVNREFQGRSFEVETAGTHRPKLSLLNSLARAREAVVRIAVRYNTNLNTNGSGVLVNHGRHVLTCGHVVEVLDRYPKADIEFFVRDRLGTTREENRKFLAKVVERQYDPEHPEHDWCLLRVVSPVESMPWVPIATSSPGQTLLGYGYPSGLGLNRMGEGQWWTLQKHLNPVLIVVRVPGDSDYLYDAVAGGRTIGGMSGGPLFDTSGAVVGVITGHSRTIEDGEATFRVRTSKFDRAMELLQGK